MSGGLAGLTGCGSYSALDQADELRTRRKEEPCEDCQGTGRAAYHVCRTDEECRRLCLEVEACMGCLGTGVKG